MPFLVVAPRFVAREDTLVAALRRAESIDRAAEEAHGPGAGADCWLVGEEGETLSFLGLACGRRVLPVGCGDGPLRECREAILADTVRAARF